MKVPSAIALKFLLWAIVAISNFEFEQSYAADLTFAQNNTANQKKSEARSQFDSYNVAQTDTGPTTELNIGGTLFRVPCRYRPYIEDANGKRVICGRISGERISSIIFAITTADRKIWEDENYPGFPWIKTLYNTQIRIQIDIFNNKDIFPEEYKDFILIPKMAFSNIEKVPNTEFILHIRGRGGIRYFVNERVKTPYGSPLVFLCSYPKPYLCSTKYKWGEKVWINYRFNPEYNRPVEKWHALDGLVRQFIKSLQVEKMGN